MSEKGQKIGYARVSTYEQNPSRQIEAFAGKGVILDKIFTDKASGRSLKRPAWEECAQYLREGDTLYISSIDRLARSLSDFLKIVTALNAKGIGLVVIKHELEFLPKQRTSSLDKLRMHLLVAFAEYEGDIIKERQREGIEIAKARKKYKGRQSPLRGETRQAFKKALEEPSIRVADLARQFKVCRATIYNWRRKLEGEF
ncbi:transposase (plasmid) [Deltaproteobacteria bacterium Smac51]|nr:transposase [Deltaproteobacteria bacterium Smac51]